ncbi:unnamed protein product [Cladocopium goreaui]|uniref:Uncharacterized protein n=1 Tax=Cladocopium goreaui TaxID=2562237 RepID=A0A9P1GG27_9DINO|nr:unnamed protein product [Cladocopium goreaui]
MTAAATAQGLRRMRRLRFDNSKLGTALIARSSSAEEVLVLVAQNLKRLDHIHCTASLHALAKHSLTDDALAKRTLTALLSRQHDFARRGCLDGRQLSNTLWALARLRQPALEAMPSGLTNQVAAQLASSKAQQLNHQDISNGLWAMAALDVDLEDQADLMSSLASRAEAAPEGFKAQELANTIWALATCGTGIASRIAQKLTAYCVVTRILELESIQLAAMIWAVAAAGLDGPILKSSPAMAGPLMQPLAAVVRPHVQDFGPQEVANVSWALAVETIDDPQLRDELALGVQRCMYEFKRKELVNTLWAFAVFGSPEVVD